VKGETVAKDRNILGVKPDENGNQNQVSPDVQEVSDLSDPL